MQILADLHTHTVASTHAYSTVSELAESARARGVKLLAVTDHGPAAPDSPHIYHFRNYKVLPRVLRGVTLLTGVEANILGPDGNIDMEEPELSHCEWVVASYHLGVVSFERTVRAVTNGYLRLCENPFVDVIGHPITNDFPVDFRALADACAKTGKFLEINESSLRYKPGAWENALEMLRCCKDSKTSVTVSTDAHFCEQVGRTPLAERLLSEAAFPEDLIVSLDPDRVLETAAKRHRLDFKAPANEEDGL